MFGLKNTILICIADEFMDAVKLAISPTLLPLISDNLVCTIDALTTVGWLDYTTHQVFHTKHMLSKAY